MFMNFRRIHKFQCVQLLTTGLLLFVMISCWEELDHHVVSHVRSFTYRYLVNRYDFLNSSFTITTSHGHRPDGSNSVDEGVEEYFYLINHPGKCQRGGAGVLLLLFVKSSPENIEQRQAIRATWGNESIIWSQLGEVVKVVFVLGMHPDVRHQTRVQAALLVEDHTYEDLIQQNFADTFHNLTLKLVMQFQWSQNYCPHARFLMSADDDIFVHVPNLVKYLQQLTSSQLVAKDLWFGHVHRGSPPVRHKHSKYHVPYEIYPWPSYPDYTAGAGYVVSADVAAKIYRATLILNSSIYIDDVFMGICAKAMGVSPQEHMYFSGEGKAPNHPCIYDRMMTSHGHGTDMHSLWQAATNSTVYTSRGYVGKLYCTAVRIMLLCFLSLQNSYSCLAAFT
ncbi:lactosylceramide 1,3-N-acetyl-beta-D-glucosaminyltransferase A-like [Betta splendens]|uniref:Hexosyltransferase n=1 Tax=Betta splendens TaxID=158456 RepID=A0A6P7MG94_BETSP|nr:lactosylceramide 1,3-N-acetyl-beta-D-glucosaminyltransferase A-like [Betta splendens]